MGDRSHNGKEAFVAQISGKRGLLASSGWHYHLASLPGVKRSHGTSSDIHLILHDGPQEEI